MWQKKLSVSDSVISIWFEVQRTWSHLESIFIGSEDIRNQLPEDSKRFDGIDVDFKVSERRDIWIKKDLRTVTLTPSFTVALGIDEGSC